MSLYLTHKVGAYGVCVRVCMSVNACLASTYICSTNPSFHSYIDHFYRASADAYTCGCAMHVDSVLLPSDIFIFKQPQSFIC